MKSTAENEAKECFKLFDKRERNFINGADLKAVLGDYLEFAVSE
jgi:Ca2+-binding EF-hand superfamily protein